jgi:hypothetical protein
MSCTAAVAEDARMNEVITTPMAAATRSKATVDFAECGNQVDAVDITLKRPPRLGCNSNELGPIS